MKLSLGDLNLILNLIKSKVVIFQKSDGSHLNNIGLDEAVIEAVDDFKYLGFYFNCNFRDNKDVEIRLNGFCRKSYSVYRNFNTLSIQAVFISIIFHS